MISLITNLIVANMVVFSTAPMTNAFDLAEGSYDLCTDYQYISKDSAFQYACRFVNEIGDESSLNKLMQASSDFGGAK